jgi:catechol 2,3-dioxygenase-like lactoylglutathione lyase family enzyme
MLLVERERETDPERVAPSLFATSTPADGAEALDHVMFRTSHPEGAIALLRDALGIRLALDQVYGETRHVFFRVGRVTIEVIVDESVGPTDVFGGFALRTRDLDAMHARLRAAGRNVSDKREGRKPGTRVFTVRDGTCGVPVLVIRDPSRDGSPGGA